MSDSAAGRTTNGTKSALTANVRRTRTFPYRSLGLIAAVVVVSVMAYLWFQQDKNGSSDPSSPPGSDSSVAIGGPALNSEGAPKPKHAGMVQIGGGQLQMGSNQGDTDAQPVHMVKVKDFYLDIHEVTCRDYKKFIDEKKRPPPPTWKDGNYPPGSDLHPVTGVTWEDATAYAQWIGKRLPTEEEWEFAARGPEGLRYPWGNEWKSDCANVDNIRQGVTKVGSYNCRSPFGVQDLIGNAWEWTDSSWVPYPGGQLMNPPHPSDKVIRGGSWESPRTFISSTSRSGYKGVGIQTGFRCAMDVP